MRVQQFLQFASQQFPFSSIMTNNTTTSRLAPVITISHGGGPMPVLGDPSHAAIVNSLKTRVPKVLKLNTPDQPRAIVLVTAHWQTDVVSVSSGEKPQLYYDYGGFPAKAYQLKYDAPGSPGVAAEVMRALEKEGVKSVKDEKRGWDHGVFIPMMLINPKADIPIVQVSILASESPSEHFAYGRALSSLRAENIAIVGSGSPSWHNLPSFAALSTPGPGQREINELNLEFNKAVYDAVSTANEKEREKKFENWRSWPGSYKMHPRGLADHFMPLNVCAGAAGEGADASFYSDEFLGLSIWSFVWE
ncbi:unnamed protein product [Periconia digitata]|uniref:Extradiol ring-cleavage dioxygenase class III enzyme subunit B domain-containing protein n=1 Tax=Periconia digitata TaxID=1303443 RepID=A0A9W4XLG4_9PLEO|nr:unnamed protein product [Periconia digitata]